MGRRDVSFLIAGLVMLFSSSTLFAGSLLVLDGSYSFGYGYGDSNWSDFSGYLDAATSNQVTVTSSLADYSQMHSYDALLVEIRRDPTLSTVELDNIAAFIATGRRVVLFGDNKAGFLAWNSQILSVVGGTIASDTSSSHTTASVQTHPLTDGVSSITAVIAGTSTGGLSLFDTNIATLWGDDLNVLTMLDVNVVSDPNIDLADNDRFARNLAAWLAEDLSDAAVVPSPTVGMAGLLGLGLVAAARRRRMSAGHR